MRATPDVTRAAPTPGRRRRERRIRSSFRLERMAVQMVVISAQHHTAQRCCSIATQTDDFVTTFATFFNMSDSGDSDEPAAPVIEFMTPGPLRVKQKTMVGESGVRRQQSKKVGKMSGMTSSTKE